MRVHRILISLLLTLAVHSASADAMFYSFEQAMATGDVRDVLDPSIKLYFGTQPTPAFVEKSLPDSYNRSGISVMPWGRNPDVLCREGFTANIARLIRTAKEMGFDTVFNIRGTTRDRKVSNNKGFDCDGGRRTSEVRLFAEFGLTQEGAKRAEQAGPPVLKSRKPLSKNAILLPLEEVLASTEAKAVLGSVKTHWGSDKVPAYSERFGPQEYEGEGSVKELGQEGACKKAVLEALASMLEDVSEQGYDSIIRIRSYLDEQLAPNDTHIECEAGSKWASVKLLGTLAKLK